MSEIDEILELVERDDTCRETALLADEVKRLRALLQRCIPMVEEDALMMNALSRHAPFPADEQAMHDSTTYPCEELLPVLYAMFPDSPRRVWTEEVGE